MKNVITEKEFNEANAIACKYLREKFFWTDEECDEYCRNLRANLLANGFEIVEDSPKIPY